MTNENTDQTITALVTQHTNEEHLASMRPKQEFIEKHQALMEGVSDLNYAFDKLDESSDNKLIQGLGLMEDDVIIETMSSMQNFEKKAFRIRGMCGYIMEERIRYRVRLKGISDRDIEQVISRERANLATEIKMESDALNTDIRIFKKFFLRAEVPILIEMLTPAEREEYIAKQKTRHVPQISIGDDPSPVIDHPANTFNGTPSLFDNRPDDLTPDQVKDAQEIAHKADNLSREHLRTAMTIHNPEVMKQALDLAVNPVNDAVMPVHQYRKTVEELKKRDAITSLGGEVNSSMSERDMPALPLDANLEDIYWLNYPIQRTSQQQLVKLARAWQVAPGEALDRLINERHEKLFPPDLID